jgi:hypothetical protein
MARRAFTCRVMAKDISPKANARFYQRGRGRVFLAPALHFREQIPARHERGEADLGEIGDVRKK